MRAPEPQPRGKTLPWLYLCQQHTFTQDVTYPWLGHFSCPLPVAHSLAVRAASEKRPEAVSLQCSHMSGVSHYQLWASMRHRTWSGFEGQQRRAYDCSLCRCGHTGPELCHQPCECCSRAGASFHGVCPSYCPSDGAGTLCHPALPFSDPPAHPLTCLDSMIPPHV